LDRFPLLPTRGATDGTTFKGTPGEFAAFQAIRNMRNRDHNGRGRMGKRPGLEKVFSRQLGNGPIQAVATISRASGTVGFTVGSCVNLGAPLNVPSGTLLGQVAAIDDVQSMDWFRYLDVTSAGGAATNSVSSVAYDPDGEFVVAASNFTVGGFGRFRIQRYSLAGIESWAADYSVASHSVFVNALCVTKLYTFAALANNATGAILLVGFRNDTGALAFSSDLYGHANECIGLGRYVDSGTGVEYLYACFNGSAAAGTYTGGLGGPTIAGGRWALQFRSGIYKFSVDATTYGGDVLTRVNFGTPLASTAAYFESLHNSWRYSEQTNQKPHGCVFTGMCCDADGNVYFSKRNQGWGPNNTRAEFRPDGLSETYATVGKISAAGVLQWLSDTDSLREADDLGYYNDQDYPAKPNHNPSVNAVCVGGNGQVYTGGRQSLVGQSVYAFDSAGSPVWSANVMDTTRTIAEGAMVVDPADGGVIVAGGRNIGWDGSAARLAFLWKLDPGDGTILWHYDIRKNVSALAVAASGHGQVFFVTDYVS
jgi:hypothetical protein